MLKREREREEEEEVYKYSKFLEKPSYRIIVHLRLQPTLMSSTFKDARARDKPYLQVS
jgi:hypothetical protein